MKLKVYTSPKKIITKNVCKKVIVLLFVLPSLFFAQQKITLEDIWSKGTFAAKSAQGFNVLKDGLNYAAIEESNLCKYELKSGKKLGEIVNGNDLIFNGKKLDISSYALSPNEDKLLLSENTEYIYRRSPKANYFVYDIASKKATELSGGAKQMFPHFSPDGKKIAYVIENNLYIKDLEANVETQITKDGVQNKVKNGWADWVYEEEFEKPDLFDWSADSRFLAYVKFDESKVKEFTLDFYRGELYPEKYTFKYPKAGEDNSIVSVHVFDWDNQTTLDIDIGTEKDIYIPRIQFTNDANVLCIQRMNRLQNKLEYMFANASTGQSKVILTDESKTYVDVTDNLTFIGNKGFVISSERDEYNHLYYYDLKGKLINQITKGNWDVMEFKGFDEKTNTIYYVSTENGAINRDVYSINLDGKNKKQLSTQPGFTNFEFTNGYKYYISSYSNANTPPVYELHSIDGKLVKVLEDNSALKNKMKDFKLSAKTFTTFTDADGLSLNAWVILPTDFDASKKYAVYMYAYNGPGSNACSNAWGGAEYFWHQLLAQEGYMVVCADGRGTMGRGRQFKHCTYMQLGNLEVQDQLKVAGQLGNLPYVDKTRIGFQGWSYGGYMASLMISKGAGIIKSAIAVAPVTNWKYYDNIYTERFMRKPQDNKDGYENNSPINFVKNIKGNFLLIHGSADDNVHMQNSMELANAMVKNNIPFDFMLYPNKNHGIYGGLTRLHIYTKMLKFVKENL